MQTFQIVFFFNARKYFDEVVDVKIADVSYKILFVRFIKKLDAFYTDRDLHVDMACYLYVI